MSSANRNIRCTHLYPRIYALPNVRKHGL